MRSIAALFVVLFGAATLAPMAHADDTPSMSQIVGVLTRADGFQQTTLVSNRGALGFAVPGDWKAIQFDFRPPVAMAVYDVPDPSALDGASSTNCSMAFADTAQPDGQAIVGRVAAFSGAASERDGWSIHTRTEGASAAAAGATMEIVATKPEGFVTAVAMCAWQKGASHDSAYDSYMTTIFNTLLDSVHAPPAPFKARPGEKFFSPQ